MEYGMETFRSRFGLESLGETAGESAPEWPVLKARFTAALAARRELGAAARVLASGSFDATSAVRLNAYGQALCDVNRTALVDGKSGREISRACVGQSHAGARG